MEIVERTHDWDASERAWIKKCKAEGCDLVNSTEGGAQVSRKAALNRSTGGIRKYPLFWRALRNIGSTRVFLYKTAPYERFEHFWMISELFIRKIKSVVKSGDQLAINALLSKIRSMAIAQ